jgi:hypothetical protein
VLAEVFLLAFFKLDFFGFNGLALFVELNNGLEEALIGIVIGAREAI